MPTVPQRSPLPVDSTPLRRPLPGVRVIPNAPEDAFGPPALPNLTGVQQQVADIYQREKAKANQIAVNDADNKATSLRDQVLWGTQEQPGILAKKGQDAMAGVGDAIQQWNKGVGDITNTLSNDEQKLAFQNRIAGYDHALHEQVQAHVAAEHQRYDTDTTNAYVQNRVNDAVQNSGNPQLSEQNVDYAKAAIGDFAKRNGWSPDQLTEQQQKVTSQIRFGVIEKMATGGQDLDAQRYLAAHNSELLPTQLEQAQRLTSASSVKGESQRQSDIITAKATSLTDGMQQAAQITDPNVRAATEERIRQHFSDQASNDRQIRAQAFQRSSAAAIQGTPAVDLPPADKLLLSPDEYEQLDRVSRGVRNPVVTTPPSYYTHWMNQAGLSPQTQAAFLNHDFGADRAAGKVSEADFHHFTGIQLELRNHQAAVETREDKAAQAQTSRFQRSEEATTIKNATAAQKAQAARDAMAKNPALKDAAQYLPPVPPVTVPKWMVDSAQADSSYKEYLKFHGVNVDAQAATPPQPAVPKPKAPGAPISP